MPEGQYGKRAVPKKSTRRLARRVGPKVRRKPASQGHPSQGAPTVGGGTKHKPVVPYRSPTPSVPVQRKRRKTVGKAVSKPVSKKEIRALRRKRARTLVGLRGTARLRKRDERVLGIPGSGAIKTGALDILDESTRGSEAAAGAAKYYTRLLKGKEDFDLLGPVKAGWKSGGSRKDRTTFSDVLKEAGVKNKAVRIGAGLALDIAADPLTYATFGTGASAKAGVKGLTVKVGGKEIPGVRTATAKASKKAGGPQAARLVSEGGPGRAVRKLFPVRPKDISEKEWAKLSAADRERRGTIMHETRRTARKARAIRKGTGGTYRRVLPEKSGGKTKVVPRRRKGAPVAASQRLVDAVEAKDFSKLSKTERLAAVEVMGEQGRLLRMRELAGEKPSQYAARSADEPKGYVARQVAFELEDKKAKRLAKKQGKGTGSRRSTTTMKDFERAQERRAPMVTLRETHPGEYAQDVETVLRAKGAKDIERAASTKYRNRVVDLGRPVHRDAPFDPKAERVYTVKDGRLTEVKGADRFKPSRDKVVLKKAVADHANATMDKTGRIPFLDAATNKIKWVLTVPNPQFWMRNAYGGLMNVYQSGVPARHVAANVPRAIRVNRAITKQHKAEETLGKAFKGKQLPVGPKGQKIDAEDFIRELETVNVAGGGQTSELLGAEVARRAKMQGFDDLPRFTAYIHFRRKGLTPQQSAAKALEGQFDYGALSHFEKNVARRIFPFWTFRSRNTVFQTKSLVKRPGKIANIEKTRDAAAEAADLPEDWQDKLSEGERLGVPFALPGKQLLFPGLPVQDLNLISTDPTQLFQQVMQSTHPGGKAIVEFLTNYNFFWRDRIESEGRRWVNAPDQIINEMEKRGGKRAVKALVDAGILRKGKDRWSNKMTWQWRGKADYLAKLTPLTSTGFLLAQSGPGRTGQTKEQRAAAWLTGLRAKPFVPEMNRYFDLQEERAKLIQRKDDLIELRTYKGRDKQEYKRLLKRIDDKSGQIFDLEGELGKKDRTVPPSRKKDKSPSFGGGSDGPSWGGGSSGPSWGSAAPLRSAPREYRFEPGVHPHPVGEVGDAIEQGAKLKRWAQEWKEMTPAERERYKRKAIRRGRRRQRSELNAGRRHVPEQQLYGGNRPRAT